jgi:hypothetical protein
MAESGDDTEHELFGDGAAPRSVPGVPVMDVAAESSSDDDEVVPHYTRGATPLIRLVRLSSGRQQLEHLVSGEGCLLDPPSASGYRLVQPAGCDFARVEADDVPG